MKKLHHFLDGFQEPVPDVNRRHRSEQPSKDQTEEEDNVIMTFIGLAIHHHPLLFGLLLGKLFRSISDLIVMLFD